MSNRTANAKRLAAPIVLLVVVFAFVMATMVATMANGEKEGGLGMVKPPGMQAEALDHLSKLFTSVRGGEYLMTDMEAFDRAFRAASKDEKAKHLKWINDRLLHDPDMRGSASDRDDYR